MKRLLFLLLCCWSVFPIQVTAGAACPQWMNVTLDKLHSTESIELCEVVANKPVLFVNTASHCGYTYQFGGLEALHQRYKDKGLVVVGFPSDTFKQEAKDEAKTASVCYENYGVTFLMSQPVAVRGGKAHSVFKHLSEQQGKPSWNFNKYLVDQQGKVLKRYGSSVKPDSSEFIQDIEKLML